MRKFWNSRKVKEKDHIENNFTNESKMVKVK